MNIYNVYARMLHALYRTTKYINTNKKSHNAIQIHTEVHVTCDRSELTMQIK